MTLNNFNAIDRSSLMQQLLTCCGSNQWASLLTEHAPFSSLKDLVDKATTIWYSECNQQDWLEAFIHHPKIGDMKSLEEKFASTQHLARAEQAGVHAAPGVVIEALVKGNHDYEEKFNFIFIVCATGKSAYEMLRLLQDRLQNNHNEELNIAMGEQHKITLIRLKKLLQEEDWSAIKASQITSHVLDTSIGRPGQDITIKLQGIKDGTWSTISQGVTNADGRIGDLLPPGKMLDNGSYKMVFDTGKYFEDNNMKGFYPMVEIQFNVWDQQHYHVPLLINPFGYSTYRGS